MTTTTTMTTSVRLEPIQVHVGELLIPGMAQRPSLFLHMHNHTTECVLGRNTATGIEDRWVHRHAATVLLAPNGKVWLTNHSPPLEPEPQSRLRRHVHNNNNKPAASSLLVNGQPPPRPDSRLRQRDNAASLNHDHQQQQPQHAMELHHGDIITIEGRRDPVPLQYSYQVHLITTTTEAEAAGTSTVAAATRAGVAAAAAAVVEASSPPARKKAAITMPPPVASPLLSPMPPEPSLLEPIGNEAMCAICMEIQVRSRSLVPCGHSFCQTCLVTNTRRLPTSCPVCRMQPVQSHVPNLALDNMIWNMVVAQSSMSSTSSSSSFFDPQDIPTYLERSGKTLVVATSAVATAVAAAPVAAAAAAAARHPHATHPGRRENQTLPTAPPAAAAAAAAVGRTTVAIRLRRRIPPPPIQPSQPLTQSPSPSERRKRRRRVAEIRHPNVNHNQALNLGTSLANAICLD